LKLPLGYRYAAAYAGIRKEQKDDIGLIVPERGATAAAVFTTNVVQAAPVRLARKHLRSSNGKLAAVLVNAGNANCATRTGDRVALASCKAVAKALKKKLELVVPASTGVIGVELNANHITYDVPKLVTRLSADGFEAVASAILTTDTRMKIECEEIFFASGGLRVAGMTKGAGMIHPQMATTLGFVMTDAAVAPGALREMLVSATDASYNSLSIDGDMSTNDMVVLMANGASNVRPRGKELDRLQGAVAAVMESLARQIAADGEGARKLVIVRSSGFRSTSDARRVARAVANSALVKTAIAGSDPNWGRILGAAGYSGVWFDPAEIDICLQGIEVCRKGLAADFDEPGLKQRLNESEVEIRIVLNGRGKGAARFFTCDLTEGYIQINGSYRT
jgi:glutamate N-acetyltransferase / amino-acid N-acetyltransferase